MTTLDQFCPRHAIDGLLWALAGEPAAELLLKAVLALLRAEQVSPDLRQELREAFPKSDELTRLVDRRTAELEIPQLDLPAELEEVNDYFNAMEPKMFGVIIGQTMSRDLEGAFIALETYLSIREMRDSVTAADTQGPA